MDELIKKNLVYPEAAKKAKVSGTVVLKYAIDYKGSVIEAKVISGIGHGCDEEAIRLAKMLKFKMGKYRNIKVLFHKTLKIHFRFKEETKKELSVTYNVVQSKKPEVTKPKSYSYNINLPNK